MSTEEIKGKKCRWIHLTGADEETAAYLKENYKFHALDIEDVMSEKQQPKIDVYKYYLFLIAVFPFFDKERFKIRAREVDIFLTKDTLITVSKNSYPFLNHIFKRLSGNAKLRSMWMTKGASYLMYKILERLFRDAHAAIDAVGRQVAEVEDDVYENELKSVARDLAFIRRSVLTLRRMLDPQRFTMNVLVNLNSDFIPADMTHYFDNVHDHIEKAWVEIENHRDTIDGLHWTNESMISQHTNRIITILTVISASLMPLTLLAGFYGMNLNRLPLASEPPLVFALFGAVTLLTIFLVALIFRKKRQ